ncbi:MAG TPA: hypothetical protein VNY84_01235 [Acidimicrobiales bacterium]|nr:hypothetical protein [Acidimicrobiales bacterium]
MRDSRWPKRLPLFVLVALFVLASMGLTGTASPQPLLALPTLPSASGYWFVAGDGGVFSFGPAAVFQGSAGGAHLVRPAVGIAATPDGGGYWLVASDGGIFTYGNAAFFGSTGGVRLNQPIVGMAATPDGQGYWLVAADGGVFNFGDAPFIASAVGRLDSPAVAIVSAPTCCGYWIVSQRGQVFAAGAPDEGSAAHGSDRVVAMAATSDGQGYWLATTLGHVLSLGDAQSFGQVTVPLNAPIVAMAAMPDGQGYYLLGGDGGVFSFGEAHFFGSTGGIRLQSPVLDLAVPSRPASGAVLHFLENNFGDAIAVHPGDSVVVDLCCALPDMPEGWAQQGPTDSSVLAYQGQGFGPNGGEQLFTFDGVGIGKAKVSFKYCRTTGCDPSLGGTVEVDVVS